MKLPPEWKDFYLRSLQVPVLGRRVFGPLLRGLWKAILFFHRESKPVRQLPDGLLSTYASTIDALRRQLENLERRMGQLETELAQAHAEQERLRESAAVQQLLSSAAMQGLQRRLEAHEQHAGFQRDALVAAVTGLRHRDSARADNLSLDSTRCS
jgi:hypothetical protein